MKCNACSNEYFAPDIIDGVAYFVCSSCGDLYEVKNYRPYANEEIIRKIEYAFSGVVLGNGIGLFEAQAIDNYETDDEQKKRREEDEKLDWNSITNKDLQDNHSALSYFDADGMRFHLPAYIIGSINRQVDDPVFILTNLDSNLEPKFSSLNALQKKTIMEYLIWCLTEKDYEFNYHDIIKALSEYWEK